LGGTTPNGNLIWIMVAVTLVLIILWFIGSYFHGASYQ
jgi:hypothetical protein